MLIKVPKIWGQLNEKVNGSSPDPFLARLRRALRKKGLACETKRKYLGGLSLFTGLSVFRLCCFSLLQIFDTYMQTRVKSSILQKFY